MRMPIITSISIIKGGGGETMRLVGGQGQATSGTQPHPNPFSEGLLSPSKGLLSPPEGPYYRLVRFPASFAFGSSKWVGEPD